MSENLNLEIGFTFKEEELGKNAKKVLDSLNDKLKLDVKLSKDSLNGITNTINDIKKSISNQEIELTYTKGILDDIDDYIGRIKQNAKNVEVDVKYNQSNLNKIDKSFEKINTIAKEADASLGETENSFIRINKRLADVKMSFETIGKLMGSEFEIGYNGSRSEKIINDLSKINELNSQLELGKNLDVSQAKEVVKYINDLKSKIGNFELLVEVDEKEITNVQKLIKEIREEANNLDLNVEYDKRMFNRITKELNEVEWIIDQIKLDINGDTKAVDEAKIKLNELFRLSENLGVKFNKTDFNKLHKEIKSLEEEFEIDFGLTLPEREILDDLKKGIEKLFKTKQKLDVDFQYDKKALSDFSREVNKVLKLGDAIEFDVLYNKEELKEFNDDLNKVKDAKAKVNLDIELNKDIFSDVENEFKKVENTEFQLDIEFSDQESLVYDFKETLTELKKLAENNELKKLNLNVEYDKNIFDEAVQKIEKIKAIGEKLNVSIGLSGDLFGELTESLDDVQKVASQKSIVVSTKIDELKIDSELSELENKVERAKLDDVEVKVKTLGIEDVIVKVGELLNQLSDLKNIDININVEDIANKVIDLLNILSNMKEFNIDLNIDEVIERVKSSLSQLRESERINIDLSVDAESLSNQVKEALDKLNNRQPTLFDVELNTEEVLRQAEEVLNKISKKQVIDIEFSDITKSLDELHSKLKENPSIYIDTEFDFENVINKVNNLFKEVNKQQHISLDVEFNKDQLVSEIKDILKEIESQYKITLDVEAKIDNINNVNKEVNGEIDDVDVDIRYNQINIKDVIDSHKEISKASLTVDADGNALKSVVQINNALGETTRIIDTFSKKGQITTFSVDNTKEQKQLYTECVNILRQVTANEKEANGAAENRKSVLERINQELTEQFDKNRELLSDKQLIIQLDKKIEESQNSISNHVEKQKADVKDILDLKKQILRNELKGVESGKNSQYANTAEIERLRKEIESLDGVSLKNLDANMKNLVTQIKAVGSDANAKAVMRTGSAFDSLGKTLQTLGLYRSVEEMFQMLFNELAKGVEHIKEVDAAFTNMAMTMESLTANKFNNMIDQIDRLSQSMGSVSSDVLQLAQTYANDSTTIEAVIDKLAASAALMNVSGLSPDEVTSSIMSIANSYQLLSDETDNVAEVTEYLGDVLTKTSANMEMDFQAGLSGLVTGIGVAGSTMKAAGVDMEWFVGMLGNAMVSTGQSAEQLGRGMRTITARVLQQKQALEEMGESVEEVEIAMAKGEETLQEIGVTIRNNLSGELKPFSQIMDELGAKWDGLTDSTKYFLAEQLAGKNQMDIFIGMMDSYESGLDLVNNAYSAQGTLMEMNNVYAESLAGKIQTLTSAKENLYRTVINSDSFKHLLESATYLINGLTTLMENINAVADLFGGLPNTIGLATAAFVAYKVATSDVSSLMGKVIGGLSDIATYMTKGKVATDAMTLSTTALKAACGGLVTVGITMVVSALGAFINHSKRAKEAALELATEISNSYNELNSAFSQTIDADRLIIQYEQLSEKINSNKLADQELAQAQQELASTKEKLIGMFPTAIQGYDEEGNAILDNIDYIKELNEVEKERLKIEQEALAIKAQANYDSELENLENATKRRDEILEQLRKSQADLSSYEAGSVEYDSITTAIDELYESLKKTNEEVASYQSVVNTYEKALGIAKDATQEFTFSLDECREATTEAMKDSFGEEAFNSVTKSADEAQGKFLEVSQTLETTRDILKDINENGVTTSNIEKMRSLYNDFAGDITNTAQVQEFLNGKISEMQEAHDRAYVQMITTTDEWRRYNNDVQNEIVRITAKAVGMQEDEWAKYINALGGFRSVDLSNAKNLGDAKLQTEKQLIKQLVEMWKQYYNTLMTNTWKAQGHNLENMSIAKAQELEKQTLKANEEARKAYEAFTKLQNNMDSIGGSITVKPSLNQSSVGSLGSSSSGGGSGSRPSGSNTEKDVADLELVIDRYYALNDAINDVNNALDKNSIQKDNAKTIEEYNKLVEEEIRLTNQKIKALENLRREQEKEASELKNSIAKQGGTFDSSGNLTNYHKLLTDAQNKANKLSGTAKENAIANVNALKEMIDKYTELTNSSIPNTTNQILEMKNAIEDIRKEQEEIIKQVEKLGERYYNVLQSIKKVDNELALVKAKQENAHGKERVELLVREIELMKEKQKLLQQQQNESITEATEIYNDLKKQGVQFNEDGAIKNYDALMKKLTDKVNSLVGTARDEELEKAESLIELIEKYDELVKDTIPSLGVEWIEVNNDIIALEKGKLETIADVQKQITQAITSELKKQTEATKKEIDKQKQLYLDSYEEEDYQNELAKEQRKLDEIQQQINNLARDTSLAGQLKLQDLMKQYQEQQDAINNMIRDHEKQQGSDRFDEEMNKLDENLENALDPKNMAQLVADALTTGLVSVGDQVVELDKLMADFAVESEGAITALSNTIRAEMIESLKEASSLVENLGASYQTLIGYNETLSKNKHLNDVKTINSSSPKIEFNAPILTIEGDVAQDLESRLHEFANQVQNTVMKTVGRALSTI